MTSCTGQKRVTLDRQLTKDDFAKGTEYVASREWELTDVLVSAETIYSGQQHVRLLRGINQLRTLRPDIVVDLWIVSAGYGLIPGSRLIAPYEATFTGMKRGEAQEWSDHLGIPQAFRSLVAQPYDLGLVLLGDEYLSALRLDASVALAGKTLFLTSTKAEKFVAQIDRAIPIPLSIPDTRRFGSGLVGLKGEVASRLLMQIAETGSLDLAGSAPGAILDALASQASSSLPQAAGAQARRRIATPNPKSEILATLPESWWKQPHRSKLRFFVPDWDDRVDPDFDFANDRHSGGVADWSNEVYAHQLYPAPNYDGILVSRATIDEGPRKREMVDAMGIHRYLRVPPEFPVLGDCGAFSYVNEKEPWYSVEDVLDYYTRIGVDMGISVDHLVFADTPEERQFRYELTIDNAREFLREHQLRGLTWEPLGAVQGWSPESYAAAAQANIQMGYKHIALGGLIRSNDAVILSVVDAVHRVVPKGTRVHLLGVARFKTTHEYVARGVTSIDSASFIRRAWLGTDSNYLTAEKGWYASIRVPLAHASPKARKLVADGKISQTDLFKLEAECLGGLRSYGQSATRTPGPLLDRLMDYDDLLTGGRPAARERIRRTLEERPWDQCRCTLCQDLGIEIVLLRGNNRNRRRGFHNTFVFNRMLDDLVEGRVPAWAIGRPLQSQAAQLSLALP